MSLEDDTPTKEILVLCKQLQDVYDSNKSIWTMEQLYQKIFASLKPKSIYDEFRIF